MSGGQIDDGIVGVYVPPPPLPTDVVDFLRLRVVADYDPEHQARALLEKYLPEVKRERMLEDELRAAKAALVKAQTAERRATEKHDEVAKVNQRYGRQINELTAKVKAALAQQHALELELRNGKDT